MRPQMRSWTSRTEATKAVLEQGPRKYGDIVRLQLWDTAARQRLVPA